MKLYRVELHGCDDTTMFDIELSEEELVAIEKIEDLSIKTSSYGCMPILTIEEVATNDNP
jgi:hypothetical protein